MLFKNSNNDLFRLLLFGTNEIVWKTWCEIIHFLIAAQAIRIKNNMGKFFLIE